jgi:hypothetical protein
MAIDPRPLYEADQVLTMYDIMAIRNGYIMQYQNAPWYWFRKKWMFRLGVGVCNEFLHWLYHGKPVDGVKCKGGHDAVQ